VWRQRWLFLMVRCQHLGFGERLRVVGSSLSVLRAKTSRP
jgi:hypothetical protein